MKRLVLCLLILVSISCVYAQNAKQTIAVLELNPTGIAPADAQFLTDRLRSELFKTGAFQVVERDKMNAILQEQGFQRTGCTTVECAVEIGQLLNVKIIVAGSIGKIEELYSISLRMIDVQSGMIIKTATQDYHGKLSQVLTDVIPQIASDLAKEEQKSAIEKVDTEKKEAGTKGQTSKKFGVQFKAGMAFLGYTKDANDAIARAANPEYFPDRYSNHSNFALEAVYFVSFRWQIKLSIGIERMLDNWVNEKYFVARASNIKNFSHRFKFNNSSLGINYFLIRRAEKFDWYVGADMGSMQLNSHVNSLTTTDVVFDKTYTYNAFAFKLAMGTGYFINKSLRIGCELGLQFTDTFDLSGQQIFPTGYTLTIPNQIEQDILLLKKFNGSGVLLNLTLGYYF